MSEAPVTRAEKLIAEVTEALELRLLEPVARAEREGQAIAALLVRVQRLEIEFRAFLDRDRRRQREDGTE